MLAGIRLLADVLLGAVVVIVPVPHIRQVPYVGTVKLSAPIAGRAVGRLALDGRVSGCNRRRTLRRDRSVITENTQIPRSAL